MNQSSSVPTLRLLAPAATACALACVAGSAHAQIGAHHQRAIGLPTSEVYRGVQSVPFDSLTTLDNDYTCVGDVSASTTAPRDLLIARHDYTGKVMWARRVDTFGDERGYNVSIGRTAPFYAYAFTGTVIPGLRTGLVHFDLTGSISSPLWYYPGTGTDETVQDRDVGVSIRTVDPDDRVITANRVTLGAGTQDGILIRTDPTGAPIWSFGYAVPPGFRVTFVDVTELRGVAGLPQTFVVTGTLVDPNLRYSVIVMAVDGITGAPISFWRLSTFTSAGLPAQYFGDGITSSRSPFIATPTVTVSSHKYEIPGDPLSVTAITLEFDPIGGALFWTNEQRSIVPGRAAIATRVDPGTVFVGEFREPAPVGGFLARPYMALIDSGGSDVTQHIHFASTGIRYDGVDAFEGLFGKRIVADGFGSFTPPAYGGIDALVARTNSLGFTDGCPDFTLSNSAPASIVVDPFPVTIFQLPQPQIVTPAINIPALRDTFACFASPCDAIDYNNDGVFPDLLDVLDFINVVAGGPCSTGACKDVDFNNDGIFPDNQDITDLLNLFSGGTCP
jgi:hypothetical protein